MQVLFILRCVGTPSNLPHLNITEQFFINSFIKSKKGYLPQKKKHSDMTVMDLLNLSVCTSAPFLLFLTSGDKFVSCLLLLWPVNLSKRGPV